MLYRKKIIYPGEDYFTDTRNVATKKQSRPYLHLLLFLATVVTTTAVGTLMSENPDSMSGLLQGMSFSLTIILILGIHEFAHYFTARSWGIDVTLPYFIPAPIPPIGTFGAVIKMKSSIPSRRALIDVGASGPIAGFLASMIAGYIGLNLSKVVSTGSEGMFYLGDPMIFKFIAFITTGGLDQSQDVLLHPVAFAAWIGFFVTALNLLPIGQLDGGHILFAISPRVHELVRRIRIPLLILLGISFWSGWYVWAVLSLFFGRAHPYPDRMDSSIGGLRSAIAAAAVVIFFMCIMLQPVIVA